jgi:hypothetical protein
MTHSHAGNTVALARPAIHPARRALVISNLTLLSLCRQARQEVGHAPRKRLIDMYLAQHLRTWQQAAMNS